MIIPAFAVGRTQELLYYIHPPKANGEIRGDIRFFLNSPMPTDATRILFAGFQAAGTRGAAMLAGADSVKIHGQYVPVRAEIAVLHNLSAHADYHETLGWLNHFETPPRQTCITHGDPVAADAVRLHIEQQRAGPAVCPITSKPAG